MSGRTTRFVHPSEVSESRVSWPALVADRAPYSHGVVVSGGLIGNQVAPSWAFGALKGTTMPDPFPAYRSLNPRGVSSFHLGPRPPSERLTSPEPPTSQPA